MTNFSNRLICLTLLVNYVFKSFINQFILESQDRNFYHIFLFISGIFNTHIHPKIKRINRKPSTTISTEETSVSYESVINVIKLSMATKCFYSFTNRLFLSIITTEIRAIKSECFYFVFFLYVQYVDVALKLIWCWIPNKYKHAINNELT